MGGAISFLKKYDLEIVHITFAHIPLARTNSQDYTLLQGRLGYVVLAWDCVLRSN